MKEFCAICKEPVYPTDRLAMQATVLHSRCFRCRHCNGQLSLSDFAQVNGIPYCKPHYIQLFKESGGKYDVFNEGDGKTSHSTTTRSSTAKTTTTTTTTTSTSAKAVVTLAAGMKTATTTTGNSTQPRKLNLVVNASRVQEATDASSSSSASSGVNPSPINKGDVKSLLKRFEERLRTDTDDSSDESGAGPEDASSPTAKQYQKSRNGLKPISGATAAATSSTSSATRVFPSSSAKVGANKNVITPLTASFLYQDAIKRLRRPRSVPSLKTTTNPGGTNVSMLAANFDQRRSSGGPNRRGVRDSRSDNERGEEEEEEDDRDSEDLGEEEDVFEATEDDALARALGPWSSASRTTTSSDVPIRGRLSSKEMSRATRTNAIADRVKQYAAAAAATSATSSSSPSNNQRSKNAVVGAKWPPQPKSPPPPLPGTPVRRRRFSGGSQSELGLEPESHRILNTFRPDPPIGTARSETSMLKGSVVERLKWLEGISAGKGGAGKGATTSTTKPAASRTETGSSSPVAAGRALFSGKLASSSSTSGAAPSRSVAVEDVPLAGAAARAKLQYLASLAKSTSSSSGGEEQPQLSPRARGSANNNNFVQSRVAALAQQHQSGSPGVAHGSPIVVGKKTASASSGEPSSRVLDHERAKEKERSVGSIRDRVNAYVEQAEAGSTLLAAVSMKAAQQQSSSSSSSQRSLGEGGMRRTPSWLRQQMLEQQRAVNEAAFGKRKRQTHEDEEREETEATAPVRGGSTHVNPTAASSTTGGERPVVVASPLFTSAQGSATVSASSTTASSKLRDFLLSAGETPSASISSTSVAKESEKEGKSVLSAFLSGATGATTGGTTPHQMAKSSRAFDAAASSTTTTTTQKRGRDENEANDGEEEEEEGNGADSPKKPTVRPPALKSIMKGSGSWRRNSAVARAEGSASSSGPSSAGGNSIKSPEKGKGNNEASETKPPRRLTGGVNFGMAEIHQIEKEESEEGVESGGDSNMVKSATGVAARRGSALASYLRAQDERKRVELEERAKRKAEEAEVRGGSEEPAAKRNSLLPPMSMSRTVVDRDDDDDGEEEEEEDRYRAAKRKQGGGVEEGVKSTMTISGSTAKAMNVPATTAVEKEKVKDADSKTVSALAAFTASLKNSTTTSLPSAPSTSVPASSAGSSPHLPPTTSSAPSIPILTLETGGTTRPAPRPESSTSIASHSHAAVANTRYEKSDHKDPSPITVSRSPTHSEASTSSLVSTISPSSSSSSIAAATAHNSLKDTNRDEATASPDQRRAAAAASLAAMMARSAAPPTTSSLLPRSPINAEEENRTVSSATVKINEQSDSQEKRDSFIDSVSSRPIIATGKRRKPSTESRRMHVDAAKE